MSFSWTEYLLLAEELAGSPRSAQAGQEARNRSAISRAYYAAFIQARNHLRDNDHDLGVTQTLDPHKYVRQTFGTSPDRRRKRVVTLLNNLRYARNTAGYDDSVPQLAPRTAMALLQAGEVISILTRL